MNNDINDLEIQLTHQQHQLDELNELVYNQQQQIAALSSELRKINEQMQIALPSLVKEADEESPPPHY
jgi:SlyX protein